MAEKLLMLALSPTMSSGMIARWRKNEGDSVATGDILCEVETDKAVMEYESPVDGILLKIVRAAGSDAAVGDLIGIIGKAGEDISALLIDQKADASEKPREQPAPAVSEAAPAAVDTTPAADVQPAQIRSSPLARKIAQQNSLDLAKIPGSGPAGRIVKTDVEKALAASGGTKPVLVRTAAAAAVTASPADRVMPVSNMRRVIASRLAESMYTAPHYYLKVQAEIDNLLEARQRLNESQPEKVSLNAYLIRLTAEALKLHPMVNASWAGDSIIQYGHADIGIAVALPDGLITPVIRDSGAKGIIQISQELAGLIQKARSQQLAPDEYAGATFTISNLGSYGIEEFTAIINPPGSAILAVGEVRRVPAAEADGTVAVRSVMSLTLSCDHRVIDGAVGASFLSDLKNLLQEPVRALY